MSLPGGTPQRATGATERYAHSLPLGYRLLWYEIRAVLGQGGFGITYLAHDTNLDQPVAIKEYLPAPYAARGTDHAITPTSTGSAPEFAWGKRRFLEEGRVLARFDHPAIVKVMSVFEANGTAYLVMRYEQGETLDAVLKRERQLPEARLRVILDELLGGLDALHAAGFIHRDLKPGNIYLRRDGHALMIDFGAARQALASRSQTVTSLVSPGYAPFEQYRSDGSQQGPWTDLYGLAATAYRAITGRPPPPALDRSHRIIDGCGDALPRLADAGIDGYTWAFLAAVDRGLAFRVAERPSSVAAWRAMFADEEPITTPHPALTAHEATVSAPSPAFVGSPATPPEAGPTAVSTIAVPTGRAPAGGRRAAPPVSLMLGIAVAFLVAGGIRWLAEWRMNAPAAATTSTGSDATAGTPPPAPSVESLLAGAAGDLAALRLTVPTGHNALEKYRAVLDRDTDNAAALAGIDLIVGRYIDLAAAAAQTGDLASARDYLDRARSVNPDDSRLRSAYLALERSARRASRTASES